MNCGSCGTANEAGRKFCLQCGTRLAAGCPVCGTLNTSGALFCGECGSPLDASAGPPAARDAAPSAPATGPTAERRLVSVLFADLVGFTAVAESRDAEDVRELLNGYFETCREIVERYGGTVEKFIGDAVMAVWGTPVALEDDAERAVRAAIDLVDAAARLGEQTEVPELALRAGVVTGEAAVTLGAAGMGMVAGDMVNTASRLQSVAPPGTVLVGEATRRAASEAITFEPAGEQLLKGKEAPVPAFRALRVVARRGGAGRSEQLEAPFVGRESELRLIKDFFHATARDRGVRLVSIMGQGGVGKSRLAWEFQKYLDGLSELIYWHQGRSPSYGAGVSFWALGEMVRMRAGIGESDDDETTRARLAETLHQFVPDPAERQALEGPLLQLLGIGEAHGRERSELFSAWRTFFERVAEANTVVMVFEDLQWADDGLLDFIEEMLAWSRGRSIYIITLSRPELMDRRPTWGAGQRAFTSLGLEPLTDEDMRQLLAGLVPGLPETAIGAIVARAEGIPLYAVETVRMLLNDSRIERDGETYRPLGDLTELAVPESLHALIAARLDALQPLERALIQDASVLGQSFTVAALTAVTSDSAEVEPLLRHLVQREVLTIDDDPRSPERGQHRFVQGLLREVAYGTLARRDRRSRHLAAARYFETLGDEELVGVLAQHYLDAYRAQPEGDEGAAVAAQARIALRAAAQRATDLGSPRLAHRYLEDALEAVTDPAEELNLQVAAAWAAGDAGLVEVGDAHLQRAIELATQIGDAGARRRAIAGRAGFLVEGHQEQGRQLLVDALAEPGLEPSDPGYIELAEGLAKFEMRLGNSAEAVAIADRALPAMELAGADQLTVETLITRGVALANLGRITEATMTLTGAIALAERRGMVGSSLRAATNLGYTLEPEDPVRGFQVSKEGYERAARYGITWAMRYLLGNACDMAFQVGEWEWALGEVTEQLSGELEVRERLWYEGIALLLRACRGEADLARAEGERLVARAAGFDDVQYHVLTYLPRLFASLAAGRLTDVIQLAEEGLNLGPHAVELAVVGARAAIWNGDAAAARRMLEAYGVARTGRRTDAARTTIEAGIATLEGRGADGRRLYADVLGRWQDLGLPTLLAFCQLDIIQTGALEPAERQRVATEARAFFERVGATPFLARLEAALVGESTASPSGATRTAVGPSGLEEAVSGP
jgi:class 3 adenylate cyclase/tetratricopeptide (TPR) repeat protein